MPRKSFQYKKLRPAPHGSKRGWRVIACKVPPEMADQIEAVATERGEFVTAFLERAIRAELERAA